MDAVDQGIRIRRSRSMYSQLSYAHGRHALGNIIALFFYLLNPCGKEHEKRFLENSRIRGLFDQFQKWDKTHIDGCFFFDSTIFSLKISLKEPGKHTKRFLRRMHLHLMGSKVQMAHFGHWRGRDCCGKILWPKGANGHHCPQLDRRRIRNKGPEERGWEQIFIARILVARRPLSSRFVPRGV